MNDKWMRRAIKISQRGFPAPNPHVGCVIVKDEKLVGEGFHRYAGTPHAEVEALAVAGNLAKDADVYVTLEPCNHFGRTPPCSQALIRANVGRVFVANDDPNPIAIGGTETLREAGIPVETGILADLARAANWQFLRAFDLHRTAVTVKIAMGIDGRIALPNGRSKWITGDEARKDAHRLRAEVGAVLVGYRTVLADDPELTARIKGVTNQPIRIVMDPDSKLTGKERVFSEASETIHITRRPISLNGLLNDLWRRKITGVLVEGGAGTISRFIEQQLVDRYEIFVAPRFLGTGLSWINLQDNSSEIGSSQLRFAKVAKLGPDLRISAFPA